MGAHTVFTGTIWNSLKETLGTIVDDHSDSYEAKSLYPKWVKERKMKDHWEEDLEMGGPGLGAEVPQGTEIPTGTIAEGYIKRYVARKIGLRMTISEEAMEDAKYPEAIRISRRLKRALFKTIDIDCTDMLVFAFDTNVPGGDGLPLCSASHTLPHGGTWSNLMATPMAPSRAALIIATSQLKKLPGHDGIIEGFKTVRILCPTEQWAVWKGIVGSTHAPEPGAFNEINVTHGLLEGPNEVLPITWWNNTTTNWAVQTDADDGFNIRWKRKASSKTWVENSNELAHHSITCRFDTGYSDARCILGVNA